MVESTTATNQSNSSDASASACTATNYRCHVPSIAHRRSRVQAPFHDPSCGGRSRHGDPVRYFHAIASNTAR
jgi:hypothetical protein